jgi:hypothetical protein
MNPARSLGPAIAGGPTDGLWVYLTAPFVGAAVAVGLYTYLSLPARRRSRLARGLTGHHRTLRPYGVGHAGAVR